MITRYSRKELTSIWSEENKYKIWLDVEVAAAEAMEKYKIIPKGVSSVVKKKGKINVARIHKIESKVKSTKKVKDTKPSNTTKKIQNNLQALAKEKKLKSQSNKKVRFSKDLKLSFLDWIKYTEENQNIQIQESKKLEPLKNKLSIIDRFIEADPKISPMEKNEPIESLINGDFNSEELMTESLAKILLRQKKYKKAIKAYKILSLKYPEKNVFFAGQIQKIRKLQQQ